LLSLGSDSAIARSALVKPIKTDTVIFGSVSQIRKLCDKLEDQPFGLKEIAHQLARHLDRFTQRSFVVRARNKKLPLVEPLICGIVNLTPDSFSGDGLLQGGATRKKTQKAVLKKVEEMATKGAGMIDLGGESTRPYAKAVSVREEIQRVIPYLKVIRKEFKRLALSIDTYKYKVAQAAVDEGVDVINDITALRASPKMAGLIKEYRLACILMHMKGTPRTMQVKPTYRDTVGEIADFLEARLSFCQKKGIKEEQLMVDPGIGFGKTVSDNFKIINQVHRLKILGVPVFIGLSRKSFIGKTLNVGVDERGAGTLSALVVSVLRGANVLRVHDVKAAHQALRIASQILNH